MTIKTIVRRLVATAGMSAAIIAGMAAPAQAYAPDNYWVYSPLGQSAGDALGTIYWNNRTATIDGDVQDNVTGTGTTVTFEAYAGGTKIDTETRTANDESDLGQIRFYNFTIGDPDLPGGIDRVRVTVCHFYGNPAQLCSGPTNYRRD